MSRPSCKTCLRHSWLCLYRDLPLKPRPSKALVNVIKSERRSLETLLIRLKEASAEEKEELFNSFYVADESIRFLRGSGPSRAIQETPTPKSGNPLLSTKRQRQSDAHETSGDDNEDSCPSDEEISQFLSVDDQNQVNAFGPTSALQDNPVKLRCQDSSLQNLRNQLFANAALQRQFESTIWSFTDIDGVPIELATHLHDLHWNRQHHSFLLTYRPAYFRDLKSGGPYWSKFLSNAIFASVSKFSNRPEVRDDPDDPSTSGGRFLRRCEALLTEDSPFDKSSIPTVAGLLLLGSAFLARGELSKSWKYYGFAFRMVFDLGLHIDCSRPGLNAEDMEIRRRVFWGAFICDKLQSLYLGRPVAMHLRDARVSCDLMDTFEENEPWTPYIDPNHTERRPQTFVPVPLHSVSTFQQFCELSKLMTRIIGRFYVAGARLSNVQPKLQALDKALTSWRSNLPDYLVFEPSLETPIRFQKLVAPNTILINTTYQSLIILLHRPFISDKHLHDISSSEMSWKKCTDAAKKITSAADGYRTAYTLRGAPYLLSYACYVACTIHVRNAALEGVRPDDGLTSGAMLNRTLAILEELSKVSSCSMRAIKIIRRLMEANQVYNAPGRCFPAFGVVAVDRATFIWCPKNQSLLGVWLIHCTLIRKR